jgi:quercetin dioxygenase-like cupin family protein
MIEMIKNEFSRSQTFSFSDSIEYSEGGIVSKTVIRKAKGNVSLFAFDKGEGLSEHTAPFDALVQIIDGKAEITIDSQAYYLNEGESIILPANVPHALSAIERFKMILTMIKE